MTTRDTAYQAANMSQEEPASSQAAQDMLNHPAIPFVPPPPPPRVTIPPIPVLATTPDPDEPVQTQLQLDMLKAFDSSGRYGLIKVIYEEALARRNQHAAEDIPWNYLIDDATPDINGKVRGDMFMLLTLLPNCIIRSLIKNTIAFDMHHDRRVAKFVNNELLVSKKPNRAGIYANVLCKTQTIGQAFNKDTTDLGKWLTHEEVQELTERVQLYIDNKDDPDSLAKNLKIDQALNSQWKPSHSTDRRFVPGAGTSMTRAAEWLKVVHNQSCKNINPSAVNDRFLRCLYEVGWAQDITASHKQHDNNSGTNALFACVKAITRMRRSYGGMEFGEPLQLILFPISNHDLHLRRVGEVLGSVLCSSYWFYGGLNCGVAQDSDFVTGAETDDEFYNSARDAISRFERHYDDEDLQMLSTQATHAERSMKRPLLQAQEKGSREEYEQTSKQLKEAKKGTGT